MGVAPLRASEFCRRTLEGDDAIRRGVKPKVRPSGHNITTKSTLDRGGSIPSNLIEAGNTASTSGYFQKRKEAGLKPHPARFPKELPDFFIRFLTAPGDFVLDPFAGSNTTGWVAENLRRLWVGFEIDPDYAKASKIRFPQEYLHPRGGSGWRKGT